MKVQTFIFSISVIAVLQSCGGKEKKPAATDSNSTVTSNDKEQSKPAPADDGKGGTVSFKVNDTAARTTKGTHTNDMDEHIGLYTEATKFLTLSLMGDVPGRPHRGWLNFNIKDFKFEPASYTVSKENNTSFSRYETENAGGETSFEASGYDVFKGTEMNLTITKIVPDPDSFNGRDWLACGTFSAKMLIKEHNPYKRTSNAGLKISEGTFENVRVAGGPKNK